MSKIECTKCGDTFYKNPVMRSIDDEYGSGRYNWACQWTGPLCYSCAVDTLRVENEDENEVPPELVIYPGIND